jgi:vesicular inhibitory amino acid transporter
MTKKPFFTFEDAKTSFNLFCCIYGIGKFLRGIHYGRVIEESLRAQILTRPLARCCAGTLGMPGNFARAGPAIAVVAMAFMAFANIYSSVAMSKVMLLSPKSVKTFGDLGEWAMGAWGRWLCVVSQMGSCLLIPCVFLVLGGSLLDGLFPAAFGQVTWIIFMALMVLPVCLVPTLKEGSGAAFAGCMGTVLADVIGVAVVMHGMRGHPSVPFPELKFSQVAGVFGNLSLAYGAGIVIPDLQRQHSDPTRMPRVVAVTVGIISCLFLTLASTAYSAVGCQITGNLLFTIYPSSETGLTTLGFAPRWGTVVMAYIFMQLHITIAFSVILNPAFYIAERLALGMHKKRPSDLKNPVSYAEAATPDVTQADARRSSKMSYVSVADAENEHKGDVEEEMAEYRGGMNTIKYVTLRIVIIAVLVVLSIIFKDHFSDFADFVGASCITVNCILLPIVFYLIKAWDRLPVYEKIAAIIVTVVCFVLGCYVTYTTGKSLFAPTDNDASFPFCSATYENEVFYNYTAEHEL